MPRRSEPVSVEASAIFSEIDCLALSGSAVAQLPFTEAYEIATAHVAIDPEPA